MSPIVQEDSFGCGTACVSFVLKISYKDGLKLFTNGKKRVKSIPDFYCREIVSILNKTEGSYFYKYVKKKIRNKIYQSGMIVFIRKSKKYRCGHYLVRYKNKWMDPWINFPDKDRKAGFRKKLPGKPIYMISSVD